MTHSWSRRAIFIYKKAGGIPLSLVDDPFSSKPDARHFIGLFTQPGDLVLDPFGGSGTTAVAALRLGRRIWTCDISSDAVATARARVAETMAEAGRPR